MREEVIYGIISASPYSTEVKRSVWAIYHTGYISISGRTTDAHIEYIEDIVVENGLFIGGRCSSDDYFVLDLDDLVYAIYTTIIGEYQPPKPFTRKVTDLYKKSCLKFN